MPKAILKFKLPKETIEFNDASNGGTYKSILWELDQFLRQKIKYEEHSEDFKDACEILRENIHFRLEAANLSLD